MLMVINFTNLVLVYLEHRPTNRLLKETDHIKTVLFLRNLYYKQAYINPLYSLKSHLKSLTININQSKYTLFNCHIKFVKKYLNSLPMVS